MTITRRELLAGALAAPKAGRWTDDRLGIFCHLDRDERSARQTLAAARAAGFRRAQIPRPWPQVNEALLSALPSWLTIEDVRAEVLSAYVNCCEPANVIMECRREDFARAIDLAGSLENLIASVEQSRQPPQPLEIEVAAFGR
ncbi:MAG: hypothetical protein AAB225_15390 [Acidobacteriota bacterium]